MDCRDVRDDLLNGGAERSEAFNAHLSSCPACAELAEGSGDLARSLGGGEPLEEVPSELRRSLDSALAVERGALAELRSLPHRVQLGLATGLALLLVAAGGLGKLRVDMDVYPNLRMGGVVALLLVFGALALIHRLRPLHKPPIRSRTLDVLITLTLALPFVLAALPAVHESTSHPESLITEGEFAARAVACLIYGSLLSLPLILLLLGLRRRVVTTRSHKLLAAASAGVLCNLVLQFSCPVTMPLHLLVSHAALVVIFGGVAWAAPRN